MDNETIRPLVAAVDRDLTRVRAETGDGSAAPSVEALDGSWAALVRTLNLGPAPILRNCPSCGKSIMRDATRCMHCWEKSRAPEAAASEADAADK